MTLVQDPTQKTNCHKNTDQHSSSIIFCLVCDKWIKHTLQHCLWTMHNSQAPTMLDFAIILRNAVWININFCKINDLWRARGGRRGKGNSVWAMQCVYGKCGLDTNYCFCNNATKCNHTPHHTTLPHNHTPYHTTHPAKPLHNNSKLSPEYFHACAKDKMR